MRPPSPRHSVNYPRLSRALALLTALQALAAEGAFAQAKGKFVIPEIREEGGTRFSNWDYFRVPNTNPPTPAYNYPHAPNLLAAGDTEGNPSNYNDNVRLFQTGSPTAFITSSNAIYDFRQATAFEVRYTNAGAAPVTNVIFQAQGAGSRLDLNKVQLKFTPPGGTETVLIPGFKALDDPGTGGFAERLVSAFQWDLTGLGVGDFTIAFPTGSSYAFYQAQLDTVTGSPFVQQLGYVLRTGARPFPMEGVSGYVERIADTDEDRFYLPGTVVTLEPEPETGFSHVGWIGADGAVIDTPGNLEYTVENEDKSIYGIFSPVSWEDFRYSFFFHENALLEVGDDYDDDAVSAPEVDHDGDGVTNFMEYAFGGDPYDPDSGLLAPVASLVTVEGVVYPAITYRKQAALETDLTWKVEESTDLATWFSGGAAPPVETASVLLAGGIRRVTVRSATPLGSGPRFLRVKAEGSTP